MGELKFLFRCFHYSNEIHFPFHIVVKFILLHSIILQVLTDTKIIKRFTKIVGLNFNRPIKFEYILFCWWIIEKHLLWLD